MRRNAVERFWSKVDVSGGSEACWPWGGKEATDYGRIRVGSDRPRAHRFSYELIHGPIPVGLSVCHKCDNPPCVNPDHLFLGTTGENTRDSIRKGRHVNPPKAQGENTTTAKLRSSQVLEIGVLLKDTDLPFREIAGRYGVSVTALCQIASGKCWSSVTQPFLAEIRRHRSSKLGIRRGDNHPMRLHPERAARGSRNGKYTKPESTLRGERHPHSKVTAAEVVEMRTRYATGTTSIPKLAKHYRLSMASTWSILKRLTWKHI